MNLLNDKYLVSRKIDIFGISLSGAFIFLLLKTINEASTAYMIITLLISIIFDNGHVYMTFSRVFKEYEKAKMFFILVPIGIFVFFFIWLFDDIPLFWSFVLYATIFHFTRQVYGINRWYMKKENMNSRFRDFIIYAVVLVPLFSMSFNPDFTVSIYTENDYFLFQSEYLPK